MDRPHILIVSDLKNTNNSSVMKLGADIRVNYIASMLEQNLDVSVLHTDLFCVPFKFSFGDDELLYGQVVLSDANMDFHMMTSNTANIGSIKLNEIDLILTPAVINTFYMSYVVCFGEELNDSNESEKYVPLNSATQVDLKKLWFLPNAEGSDVDSLISSELASLQVAGFKI